MRLPAGPRGAWGKVGLTLGAVIALDQVTKEIVRGAVEAGESHGLIPGVHIVHVTNKGVAFGFFSGGGALVLALTAVALLVLVAYFVRHPGRSGLWLATGLLLGGAIGNLVDRIARGGVTDFIKLPYWPAFNVADTAITFGVLTLLWALEGPHRRRADADSRRAA